MNRLILIVTTALIWTATGGNAPSPTVARRPGEADLAFAERILHVGEDDDPHVVSAPWNGVPTLFVDYTRLNGAETNVPLVALMRQPDGRYRTVTVTEGEEEGGTANLGAIGFADADHCGQNALIAILTWKQFHKGTVEGTLYEVRLFAPPRPDQTRLTPAAHQQPFRQRLRMCALRWPAETSRVPDPFPIQDYRRSEARTEALGVLGAGEPLFAV